MLTESEKLWLAGRGKRPFCNYCANERGSDDCEWDIAMGQCPIRNSHKKLLDALEFAERVAARLAAWGNEYHKDAKLCPHYDTVLDDCIPLCQCVNFCKSHPMLGCTAVKLARARIVVEEEMYEEA